MTANGALGEKVQHFKVVVVGDPSVGKSSLVKKFVDNKFSERYEPTIGVDFKVRHVLTGGNLIKMSIWDNSGCAKFRSIIGSYLRNAQGIVLVFDVTNLQSYIDLRNWLCELDDQGVLAPAAVSIVANKIDAKSERKVGRDEARNFAFSKGFQYMEVSALSGEGVEEAFEMLATFMLDKKQTKEEEDQRRKTEELNGKRGELAKGKGRHTFLSFITPGTTTTSIQGESEEGLLSNSEEEDGMTPEKARDARVEKALRERENSFFGRWLCW